MITRVKAVFLVAALAGCDKIFSLEDLHAPIDASADAARFSCAAPLLADEFTAATACSPWGTFTSGGVVTASEANMALVFELSDMGEAKCVTMTGIAVPSGGLAVRAAQTPAGATSYMSLESDALNLSIYFQAGRLNFSQAGGSAIVASAQYNALEMQYWRLEPDLTAMSAAASYSPDGITWTTFPTTMPLATPASAIDVRLKAGAFGIGTPTRAVFEHLVACP